MENKAEMPDNITLGIQNGCMASFPLADSSPLGDWPVLPAPGSVRYPLEQTLLAGNEAVACLPFCGSSSSPDTRSLFPSPLQLGHEHVTSPWLVRCMGYLQVASEKDYPPY